MSNTSLGPGSKGSKLLIQKWVNQAPNELSNLIVTASPSLLAYAPTKIDWLSPLSDHSYREYRDDFLVLFQLQAHVSALRSFWPERGPQWDALADIEEGDGNAGILLVEAKAHTTETQSTWKAESETSKAMIRRAFARVQGYMGVEPTDWTTGYYQLANRLAFLYFLTEILHKPAFLALVNFVDDASHVATSLAEWRRHYQRAFAEMGIRPGCRMMERVILVFPKA